MLPLYLLVAIVVPACSDYRPPEVGRVTSPDYRPPEVNGATTTDYSQQEARVITSSNYRPPEVGGVTSHGVSVNEPLLRRSLQSSALIGTPQLTATRYRRGLQPFLGAPVSNNHTNWNTDTSTNDLNNTLAILNNTDPSGKGSNEIDSLYSNVSTVGDLADPNEIDSLYSTVSTVGELADPNEIDSLYSNVLTVGDLAAIMRYEWFSPSQFIQTFCPCTTTTCVPKDKRFSTKAESTFIAGQALNSACCAPCDCSDDCFASGKCCLTKKGRATNFDMYGYPLTRNNEECTIRIAAYYRYTFMERFTNRGQHAYLVVTSCNKQYSGDAWEKCTYPNADSLDEMTPVFIEQTGLSYASIYCAECNFIDVDQVKPWTLQVRCEEPYFLNTFIKQTDATEAVLKSIFRLKRCALLWTPLNVDYKECHIGELQPSQCKNDIENTTAGPLKEWCTEINAPTYFGPNLYRNVFCLACQFDSLNHSIAQYSDDFEQDVTSFNAIVNEYGPETQGSNRPDLDGQNVTNNDCDPDRIFSPDMKSCLPTSCPPSMFYKNGTCSPYLTYVDGVYLDVLLTMSLNRSLYPDTLSLTHLVVLVTTSGVLGNNIECSHIIDSSHTNDWHHYTVQFVVNYINFTSFEKSLNGIRHSVELYSESPNRKFNVSMTKTGYQYVGNVYVTPIYYNLMETHCPQAIAVSDEQFCRTVVFSHGQYSLKQNDLHLVKGMVSIPRVFHVTVEGAVTIQHEVHVVGKVFKPYEYYLRYSRTPGLLDAHVCIHTFFARLESSLSTSDHSPQYDGLVFVRTLGGSEYVEVVAVSCTVISIACLIGQLSVRVVLGCKHHRISATWNSILNTCSLILAQVCLQLSVREGNTMEVQFVVVVLLQLFWLAFVIGTCTSSFNEFKWIKSGQYKSRPIRHGTMVLQFCTTYIASVFLTIVGQPCKVNKNYNIIGFVSCTNYLTRALSILSFIIPIICTAAANAVYLVLAKKLMKEKKLTLDALKANETAASEGINGLTVDMFALEETYWTVRDHAVTSGLTCVMFLVNMVSEVSAIDAFVYVFWVLNAAHGLYISGVFCGMMIHSGRKSRVLNISAMVEESRSTDIPVLAAHSVILDSVLQSSDTSMDS